MSYWNYRVVRKKHIHTHDKKKYTTYTYGIHEAFYDDNDFVGSITMEPMEPFGTTVSGCEGSVKLMTQAFTRPILDYDQIPELGYTKEADPIQRGLAEALAGNTVPHEKVMKSLRKKFNLPKFNYAKAMAEDEAERILEEEKYNKSLKKMAKKSPKK